MWKRLKTLFKQKWIVAFLGYAAFLSSATIIARFRTQPIFSGIGTFGLIRNGKWNKEIIVNIVLFIPYTFFYSKAFSSGKSLLSSFLLSLCTSVFIELFQVVFWVGQGTVADVIHNVMGGLIGYSLQYLINMYKRKHTMKNPRCIVDKTDQVAENWTPSGKTRKGT